MFGNSGYNEDVKNNIALSLLKNVNYCRDNKKFINPEWLK